MPVKREGTGLIKSKSIGSAIKNLEQPDLSGTSLMSVLHLGSGMQLKHANVEAYRLAFAAV